jgi:hypothetical protein
VRLEASPLGVSEVGRVARFHAEEGTPSTRPRSLFQTVSVGNRVNRGNLPWKRRKLVVATES